VVLKVAAARPEFRTGELVVAGFSTGDYVDGMSGELRCAVV
jgi:hypothetical protein